MAAYSYTGYGTVPTTTPTSVSSDATSSRSLSESTPLFGISYLRLENAPKILLCICGAQTLLLLISVFLGTNRDHCDVYVPAGGSVNIDCDKCNTVRGIQWQDWLLLLGGLGVIGCGVYSAIKKDKQTCRIYGFVMMVYAFIIGLTCVLTALEVPVLSEASDNAYVKLRPKCQQVVQTMTSNTRDHAICYAFMCLLDAGGAIFAMYSHVYFDFQEISKRVVTLTASYDSATL